MANITPICKRQFRGFKSMLAPSRKGLPPSFSLAKKKIHLDTHFKKELIDLFGSRYFLFQQAEQKQDGEHFWSWLTLLPYIKDSVEEESMLFTHFYFMQRKKQKPILHLQQAENILALNPQVFCQQINKNTTHW